MMKSLKLMSSILLCGCLFAGCSSNQTSTSTNTSEEKQTESTEKKDTDNQAKTDSTKEKNQQNSTTEEKKDSSTTENKNDSSTTQETNNTTEQSPFDSNIQSLVDGAQSYLVSTGVSDDLTLTGIYAGSSDNGIEMYQLGYLTSSKNAYLVTYYTDINLSNPSTYTGWRISHWVNGICGQEACPGSENYTYSSAGEVNAAVVNTRQAYSWTVLYELEAPDQDLFKQGQN